jgi:hypothetical protein
MKGQYSGMGTWHSLVFIGRYFEYIDCIMISGRTNVHCPAFPMRRPNALSDPFCLFHATLRCLLLLRLEGLLAIALDHDDREEAADNGGAEYDEDYRDADGPDAWQEEVVEEVVVVDKWLKQSGFEHVE